MTDTTVERLLPCPFCGKPAIHGDSSYGYWQISCSDDNDCSAQPCVQEPSAAEAITAWNARTQQPRPDASVDGLAGELAHEIESLYAEATHNPCTCNVDENGCPYCGAWSKAIDESRALILAALTTREAVVEDDATVERVARAIAPMICRPVHNGDCDDVAAGQAFARRVAAAAIRATALEKLPVQIVRSPAS